MALKVGDFVFQDGEIAKITQISTRLFSSGYTIFFDGTSLPWSISNLSAVPFSIISEEFKKYLSLRNLSYSSNPNEKFKNHLREAIKWECNSL